MRRRAPGHKAVGWRHLGCFHPPVGMHVDQMRGSTALSGTDRARVAARLRAAEAEAVAHGTGPRTTRGGGAAAAVAAALAAAAPPQHQKRHPEEVAARGVAGKRAAAAQAKEHAHDPGDARFRLTPGAGADAPPGRAAQLHDKYEAMSVAELKEVLRANEQLLQGGREELVARCADGEAHGGLPACPTCGIGRLHHERDAATGRAVYTCPGYFDTQARTFVRWCVRPVAMPRCLQPAFVHGGAHGLTLRRRRLRHRRSTFASEGGVERTKWVMPGGATQRAPGVA